MYGAKYIGLDVHQATISVAVMDSAGKLVMESAFGSVMSFIAAAVAVTAAALLQSTEALLLSRISLGLAT